MSCVRRHTHGLTFLWRCAYDLRTTCLGRRRLKEKEEGKTEEEEEGEEKEKNEEENMRNDTDILLRGRIGFGVTHVAAPTDDGHHYYTTFDAVFLCLPHPTVKDFRGVRTQTPILGLNHLEILRRFVTF